MVDQYGGARYGNAKDDGVAAYQALFGDGSSGFAALLGGWRSSKWQLQRPRYRTATTGRVRRTSSDNAWYYNFNDGKLWRNGSLKTDGRSVRCIQPAR